MNATSITRIAAVTVTAALLSGCGFFQWLSRTPPTLNSTGTTTSSTGAIFTVTVVKVPPAAPKLPKWTYTFDATNPLDPYGREGFSSVKIVSPSDLSHATVTIVSDAPMPGTSPFWATGTCPTATITTATEILIRCPGAHWTQLVVDVTGDYVSDEVSIVFAGTSSGVGERVGPVDGPK